MSETPIIASLALAAILWSGPAVSAAPPSSAPPAVAPPAPAAPQPSDDDLAHPDPAAVVGRLPNGLRYMILQHPSHDKESVRLFVEAGSRDETDAERGVAHFLEHMAFVAARSFPGDQLETDFAHAGVAWGRDQNAFTTYRGTTFVLDLSEVDEAKLDLGFRWLGDAADGLVFDPAAVDRERQVVRQEYILTLGAGRDAGRRAQAFATPDVRAIARSPIGDEAGIAAANAATLQRFHSRWYRPDRTLVVAAGDEPAEAILRRIVSTFGAWRSAGPAPAHPGDGTIDLARPTDALALAEAKLPGAVSVCRFGPADPKAPESVATHRLALADRIWLSALSRRFQSLTQSRTPAALGAGAARSRIDDAGTQTCFAASPLNDDWKGALKLLADEARRMSAHGITAAEFDFARTQILAGLDQAVAAAPTRSAAAITANMLADDEAGGTFDTAEENRRIVRLALDQLDVPAVDAAFRRRWDGASAPLLTVISPKPVTRADVLAAWVQDMAAPAPDAWADRPAAVWPYEDFGPPGKVVRREALHDPDFVRLTFANGVVVNFKQTAFARNTVQVRVRFGAGQQEIAPGHIFEAGIGASLLRAGGLGKATAQDIAEVCKGHACSATLSIDRRAFILGGGTRTQDLRLELQLLAAFLTDPGFDDSLDQRLPSAVHAIYQQTDSVPALVASHALQEALPAPHVADVPTEAAAAAITSRMFRQDLETPLTSDALEVTVVGDVDEATATGLIARTLGALKPRPRLDHTRPDAVHTRYPDIAPPPILAPHRGPKEQAFVLMTWPLYVWDPSRVHEGRVMLLLRGLLQDAITDSVRRDLGDTYAPSVALAIDEAGDQGSLSVSVQTTPADAQAVVDAVRRIARAFAGGGITAEALERTRTPLLAADARQATYNGWWVQTLSGSSERPRQVAPSRTRNQDIAAISLDEIASEARYWLSPVPLTVISLPAAAP